MYIVFDVDSTMEVRYSKYFHFAKKYCDKLNEEEKRRWAHQPKYARAYDVQHVEFYENYVVYWKQVKNLVSSFPVWIKSNTPPACNPSSETYWSM